MGHRSANSPYFFGHTIIFVVAVLLSFVMFASAILLLLSELIGSWLIALSVVGACAALIAYIIYVVSLRPRLEELEDDFEGIITISRTLKYAYSLITMVLK